MYWIANYFTVAAGRTSDYMAWGKQYHAWLKAQPGFQVRTVLNSYSYPNMYTGAIRWESRDAARSATGSAEFGKFLAANNPQGIITFTRPTEAFEAVLTVGDTVNAGKFLIATEWHVDGGKTAAFEKSRQELFELRHKLGQGFCFSRLYSLMGNPYRYLGAGFYTTREAAVAASDMPEFQEHLRAHPWTEYASVRPVTETYEVVPTE